MSGNLENEYIHLKQWQLSVNLFVVPDMFRLIADQQRRATERKLGLLLHDCVQIPRVLGEVTAFGGANVEPSVKSCFEKAGKNKDMIEVGFKLTLPWPEITVLSLVFGLWIFSLPTA